MSKCLSAMTDKHTKQSEDASADDTDTEAIKVHNLRAWFID